MTPGLGRVPEEGNGNSLQYSCLGNPMDRGAWWAARSPWGLKESDMTEQLTLQRLVIYSPSSKLYHDVIDNISISGYECSVFRIN